MAKLLVIAGPQSSGKTTVFNYLKNKFSKFKFIEEISPYTLMRTDHPKYMSTSGELQTILTRKTLAIIKSLKKKTDYLFETGPMQVVYIEKFADIKTADACFNQYVSCLKKFDVFIIFIDTKPQISFNRRKIKYLKRIERFALSKNKNQILKEYKQKIFDLYPLWKKWFRRMPFSKVVIKNSFKSQSVFLKEVKSTIATYLSQNSNQL